MQFNYQSSLKNNCVVVLGAGPSLGANLESIKSIIHKENPLVYTANYNFSSIGINADYTFFSDIDKFRENRSSIKSKIIVSAHLYSGIRKNKDLYVVGCKNSASVYTVGRIVITDEGLFPYEFLGTGGFGAILVSLLSKPKKMILLGFDGPIGNVVETKKYYNNKEVPYGKPKKHRKLCRYLGEALIPTIKEKGTTISCFKTDNFYGLDKGSLGLTIL